MTSGLVMVIDGVDECTDEGMQRCFLNILKGAGERGGLPLRLKFLICSRPEPRLRAILETADDNYITAPRAKSTITTTNSTTSDIPQRSPTVPPANTGQSEIPIVSAPKHPLSLGYQVVRIKIEVYLSVAKAQLDASRRWRPRYFTVLPSDAWKLCRPMQLGVDKAYPSAEIPDELDKLSPRLVISRIQIGLSDESKDDIRIYLTDKFNAIRRSENAIPSEHIEDLVKISCGHFLYASTIVKLLDDPSWNPKHVLKMACSSSLPTPDLDKLYSTILDNAGEAMRREDKNGAETDLVTLRDVFGILVVLWENVQLANIPESFPIIECLLVLEKGKLDLILRKMHSILDIIPGKSIRVYHRSFFEFLQHSDQNKRHYIAYSIALQRFLVLLGRVGLRYMLRRCCGLLHDDEKK
ncbi:hypothetical protein M378DRAFT_454037 [Amanita muscaria Koide BX008]|uniref:NACHT domain-containing protein n=1 Tax=Amanita muscaria (strain Koide BX008) TaxID=946122 RepID=A0A0C2S262_AMAMK|nr:hypothetical protein M378DRAFT_454037 [Amanita muscaria Koide BX008]